MAGREKVDLYADANLGVFGLLRPDNFAGLAMGDKVSQAISAVLQQVSFPSLNIIFATSARLRVKDQNDLKVDSRLDEMELRVKLTPMDEAGVILASNTAEVLGLSPYNTEAAKVESPLQIVPDISAILSAIPGIPAPLTGIVSALGLSFGQLIKPKFPILDKAFLADRHEFGWYLKSLGENQKEGIHYGIAILQVNRTVKKLKVRIDLGSDWNGGGVDNQMVTFERTLELRHPDPPRTPQITDFTSPDKLPLTVHRDDVKTLLAITDSELNEIISRGILSAFGQNKAQITKGSLLKLLGLDTKTE